MSPTRLKNKIIAEVAQELGIHETEVTHILNFVFGYAREVIGEGNSETVRIPDLGVFTLKRYFVTKFRLQGKGQRDHRRLAELPRTKSSRRRGGKEKSGDMLSMPPQSGKQEMRQV